MIVASAKTRLRSRTHQSGVRWNPKMMPNAAELWLADNGGSGSSWAGLIGGRTLIQATGASQPVVTANAIGTRSALVFNGSKFMDCVAATWGSALVQPYTLLIVGYTTQDSTRAFTDSASGTSNRALVYGFTGGKLFMDSHAQDLGGVVAVTSPSLIACVFNGVSNSNLYVNNMTTPAFTGNADTGSFPSLRIGQLVSGGGGLNGGIGLIMPVSGIPSAASMAQMSAWTKTYYGIATS